MRILLFPMFFMTLAFSFTSLAKPSSPHFFVFPSNLKRSAKLTLMSHQQDLAKCRDNIRKVICLVEPNEQNLKPEERLCLPGGQDYAVHFEQLFDHSPHALQQMYCSLNFLFIEKQFIGTAYAGTLEDANGTKHGAVMGIRQSVLDQNLQLATWATWKEQLSFGGNTSADYILSPELQQIETRSKAGPNDFLYFVVTHEFGHIFDFANKLNHVTVCHGSPLEQDPACDLTPESWGSISWLDTKTPKPENSFSHFPFLCFYWCEGKTINKSDLARVYQDFSRSDFISLYGTRQPWDDFADSLAYFMMDRYLETTYVIDTRQGVEWDIMTKLHSEGFKKKFDYIENFLKRPDLIYP